MYLSFRRLAWLLDSVLTMRAKSVQIETRVGKRCVTVVRRHRQTFMNTTQTIDEVAYQCRFFEMLQQNVVRAICTECMIASAVM